jgi:hypothetical protein
MVLKVLAMLAIKKRFVTDEENKPIAVQIDIETFHKIEQLLEDFSLGQYIEENDPSDVVSLQEAKTIYAGLRKGKK